MSYDGNKNYVPGHVHTDLPSNFIHMILNQRLRGGSETLQSFMNQKNQRVTLQIQWITTVHSVCYTETEDQLTFVFTVSHDCEPPHIRKSGLVSTSDLNAKVVYASNEHQLICCDLEI